MEIPEPTNFVLAVMGATLFGLISVPHCLGMCGPLHLAVCLSGGKRSFKALSIFNVGRIAGYTALGLVCGLFGAGLSDLFSGGAGHESTPAVHAEAGEGETRLVSAPASCCEAGEKDSKDGKDQEDGALGPENMAKGEESSTKSHEDVGNTQENADEPRAGETAAVSGDSGGHGGKKPVWRRALMFLFPAGILLLSGVKALRRKAAVVGGESGGLFAWLFNRSKKAGPVACGAAAALIPCGMLYAALAFAASTLSAFLGATFMFVYCFTISFFMQLSIMVGTTFGRNLGPKVDRAFPWLAFGGAAVYVTLFFAK